MCMCMFNPPDSRRFIEKFIQSASCNYTRDDNLIVYELNVEAESVGSFSTELDYLAKYS